MPTPGRLSGGSGMRRPGGVGSGGATKRLGLLAFVLTAALVRLNQLHGVTSSSSPSSSSSSSSGSLMAAFLPSLLPSGPLSPPPPPPAGFEPLENLRALPAFSAFNHSQFILGATLTRDERFNHSLFVDVFFMGACGMVGGTTFTGVVREDSEEWQAAVGSMTRDVRQRAKEDGFEYRCLLQLPHAVPGSESSSSSIATVGGLVVPTDTTVDGNVNDMVNILRCRLPPAMETFARRYQAGQLHVGVVEAPPGEATPARPMVNFTLPLASRTTGFLTYDPAATLEPRPDPKAQVEAATARALQASASSASFLDAWQEPRPGRMHLCVGGLQSAFATPMAELVVEFVEYHLMQGVDFVFLGADYAPGSKDMERMALVLEPYIREGKVAISSTAVVPGRPGLHRELRKIYHYNQCLYWNKGLSAWTLVWDIDEFLTPRAPGLDIKDLVAEYAAPAVNDGRDVCFLLFTSYSHALTLPEAAALDAAEAAGRGKPHLPLNDSDARINWVGRRFAATREDGHDDGYQKCILSSKDVYFTGFHLPGACTARARWEDWTRILRDDDPEWRFYAKQVAKEEAAVFHFRVVLEPISYVRSKVWEASEYSLYYFDRVLERIRARGLEDLLVQLKRFYRPCDDEEHGRGKG